MMSLVKPEKCRLPDPIADAAVEQGGPQRLARRNVPAAKGDACQSNDTGISRREIAPTRIERPQDELDHVPAGIAKTRQRAHLACRAFFLRANRGFETVPLQFADGGFELRLAVYLEAYGSLRGFAAKEDQRVIAHVRAKVGSLIAPVDQLQAKHAPGKIDRGRKVACPEADVSELVDRDHGLRASLGHPGGFV